MALRIAMKSLALVFLISSCSSNEKKPFEINQKPINQSWKNVWERQSRMEGAELDIDSIHEDTISFRLSASSGSHTGDLEGDAIAYGNKAVYVDRNGHDSCVIEFILSGDSLIKIYQKSDDCSTGIGVSYSGEYLNSHLIKSEKDTETLVSLDILVNEHQDSIFRELVGKYYEDFLSTTQLTSEDDDLDSLHANVHSSAIRGLYTLCENIVMIDSTNQIWAAVIKNEKVYYFTNNSSYKNILPKTIENWRTNFNKYKVAYIYRPQL